MDSSEILNKEMNENDPEGASVAELSLEVAEDIVDEEMYNNKDFSSDFSDASSLSQVGHDQLYSLEEINGSLYE